MVCACSLLFNCTYFIIVLGYPLKSLYDLDKQGKTDKKWILYFFLLTVFYFLEFTLLFPLKWILSKIDFCMFPTVKACFALWLYYYKGIDFIESKGGKYLDLAFEKVNPSVGNVLAKVGIKNKGEQSSSSFVNKKNE